VAIASINPATGEVLKDFAPLTTDEVEERLDRAATAFARHRTTSFGQRATWLRTSANILEREREEVADVIRAEVGKIRSAALAEVDKSVSTFRFYADHAERFLASEPIDAALVKASVARAVYEPVGPVLAVMPWNFPLWQVVRFAAPALMAGNVGLLKHASNVPQTAVLIEELFARGGFPAGVFQTLLVGSEVVERLVRDPRVRAVTLTGGEPAGRSVGALAGGEIKTAVLELGGSDPFIVMPSADLSRAVAAAVSARVQNNGQSCIAAKRFIVHEDVADAFEAQFVARMAALHVGDPMDEAVDVGPLATASVRDECHELVTDAVGRGARVLCGGTVPEGVGWFYPPTVVVDVTPEMRLYWEEAFGPVAQVHRVRSAGHAVEVANTTTFGLGASAWTAEADEQALFTAELEAGAVFVNGIVASHPAMPFGGVKASGIGRELSAHGIRAFCNVKTVWIA
jgi:succinate-semialdehyde dehydrogenase/glutarate-semialdehyde dehydrogenase